MPEKTPLSLTYYPTAVLHSPPAAHTNAQLLTTISNCTKCNLQTIANHWCCVYSFDQNWCWQLHYGNSLICIAFRVFCVCLFPSCTVLLCNTYMVQHIQNTLRATVVVVLVWNGRLLLWPLTCSVRRRRLWRPIDKGPYRTLYATFCTQRADSTYRTYLWWLLCPHLMHFGMCARMCEGTTYSSSLSLSH